MVSTFLVMNTSLYSLQLELSAVWLSHTVAAALHAKRRWATLAFAHCVTRASISLSFMTFTTWLIVGVPRIIETHAKKFYKSGTTRALWSLL